jgi:hypothetical protein
MIAPPPALIENSSLMARIFALLLTLLVSLPGPTRADDEEHFYRENTLLERAAGVTSVSTAPDLIPGKVGAYAGFTYLKSESGATSYSLDIYVAAPEPFNVIGCADDHGSDLSCRLKNMDPVKKTGLYLVSIQSLISRIYLDTLKSRDSIVLKVATDGPNIKVKINPAQVRAFLRKVDETEKPSQN